MTAHTPEGRRVRSLHMGSTDLLATTVDVDKTLTSFVWTDDVRVIGAQLSIEFLIKDAHTNTDGQINAFVELTRQAVRGAAGVQNVLLHCHTEKAWNAGIVVGNGDNRKSENVMFPAGYGMDFEEGDDINVNGFLEWLGGGGDVQFFSNTIVYFVER